MPLKQLPSAKALLWISIGVALLTIGLKTAAWWWTHSVALLSDALESLVNLASATFGLVMVTIAARPADEDHPYGYTKAEFFSSGFEGILIIAAGLGILWASANRLFHPLPLEQVGLGVGLSIFSSLLNGMLAWVMFRAAKTHRSIALDADARHLMTDVWTSAGVIAGIMGVVYTDWLWLDAVVAMGVALNILREGGHLVWRSSQGLMDTALPPDEQATIHGVLERFIRDHEGHKTIRFDHLHTRSSGQHRFIDMHMHMPETWTLGQAATLRLTVEKTLMQAVPGLHATIQILPTNTEAHWGNPLGQDAA